MAIQVVTSVGTSVALSNSITTQLIADYLEGAMVERLYDQIAMPIGRNMSELERGSSVQVNFLSDMTPGTTAISEVTDITAQTLLDATASITPTSRSEGLKASELLLIEAYTDYKAKMYQRLGKNMMETVDAVARDAACQGSFVIRDAARTSLSAASTSHRADDALFMEVSGNIQQFKIPGFKDRVNGNPAWPAIMHTFVFHDILKSGVVVDVAKYQNQGIYFNHELGSIGEFRLVVSPWAKVFYGAGTTYGTSCSTTSSTAVSALDKTISLTSTSSCNTGAFLNILDTRETANTHVHTNERVKFVSRSTKVVTLIGEGANGGLRFGHAAGVTVSNNYSAYPIVFGGRDSLAKIYATEVGEYGQIIGPRRSGSADQWVEMFWKWYGGYARLRENGIVRAEVSVSAEV